MSKAFILSDLTHMLIGEGTHKTNFMAKTTFVEFSCSRDNW